MKELTYEDWALDPTPRMMWVWDDNEKMRKKRKVICIVDRHDYPVVALSPEGETILFMRCAEIEKQRRMTNKELSRWLREKPTREFKVNNSILTSRGYTESAQDDSVSDDVVIREDDGEWREPLVETDEYKDYLESEKAYNDGV